MLYPAYSDMSVIPARSICTFCARPMCTHVMGIFAPHAGIANSIYSPLCAVYVLICHHLLHVYAQAVNCVAMLFPADSDTFRLLSSIYTLLHVGLGASIDSCWTRVDWTRWSRT